MSEFGDIQYSMIVEKNRDRFDVLTKFLYIRVVKKSSWFNRFDENSLYQGSEIYGIEESGFFDVVHNIDVLTKIRHIGIGRYGRAVIKCIITVESKIVSMGQYLVILSRLNT